MSGPTPATPPSPARRDLVVIGASAGGIEALSELVRGLPADLAAAIVVVLHVPDDGRSVLGEILDRRGPLPARAARDGDALRRGAILVAPGGGHAVIHGGHVRLVRGPRENGHRPGIDPLFRSAARAHGARAIAVVLSGLLDDGAAGLELVRQHGGACLVQDPDDALYDSMPRAAIASGPVDAVLPAAGLAGAIAELVRAPPGSAEGDVAHGEEGVPDQVELDPESADVDLRSMLRGLDERVALLGRVGQRLRGPMRRRMEREAAEDEEHARGIRGMLRRRSPGEPSPPDPSTKDHR